MKTICGYCGKETELPVAAVHNVDAYRNPVIVAMPCCGGAVRLSAQMSIKVEQCTTDHVYDDWGVPIKLCLTNNSQTQKG